MKNLLLSVVTVAGLWGQVAQASCPAGTKKTGKLEAKAICELSGRYTSDLVLGANNVYQLKGGVFIGNDNKSNASLTIEAGTKIMGASGADFLVITRGSKIFANGTKTAPIVFTTSKETNRTRGSWGGLIINGNAPINDCAGTQKVCVAEGEGSTGAYGGADENDNSGVLEYVVVEWAGYEITPDNELNGVAFQGVGAGTSVNYLQVHMNADDGVEFFGGTVNVKYLYLTGNKDDSLDWTSGWRGKAQFVVVKQAADQGNNGIEADNLSSPMNATPRSNPTLSNLTFIGSKTAAKGANGILLRKGTGASIYNSIVTGFKGACLDIDSEETFSFAKTGGIVVENNIFDCKKNFAVDTDDFFSVANFVLAQTANFEVSPRLNGLVPVVGSPALKAGQTPFDLFFDEVDFIGAIKDEASDWTKGWTTNAKN